MKILIMFLFCVFLSVESLAGNSWIASGGYVTKDDNNPWWIQNTKSVTYCVKVESDFMSIDKKTVEKVVESSLSNWKYEWDFFFTETGWNPKFQVGTQDFIKTNCDGTQDLTFIFGWEALSTEQKEFIKDIKEPTSVMGMAIRTEYDTKDLRAKGFIFINSDRGPNKMNIVVDQLEKPWSRCVVIQTVLLHELGHIFGLGHSNDFFDIMNTKTLEVFFSKEAWQNIEVENGIKECGYSSPMRYFNISKDYDFMDFTNKREILKRVFKLKEDAIGLKIKNEGKLDFGDFVLYVENQDRSLKEIGRLIFSMDNADNIYDYKLKNPISLYLNPDQAVFDTSGSEAFFTNFEISWGGFFVSKDGYKVPISVSYSTKFFDMRVFDEGAFINLEFY